MRDIQAARDMMAVAEAEKLVLQKEWRRTEKRVKLLEGDLAAVDTELGTGQPSTRHQEASHRPQLGRHKVGNSGRAWRLDFTLLWHDGVAGLVLPISI